MLWKSFLIYSHIFSVFNVEDGTEIARMNFYGRLDDAVSMVIKFLIALIHSLVCLTLDLR